MAYFQIAATPEQIQDGFRDRLDLLIKDIEPLGVFRTSMDEKPHGCLIVFNVFLAGVTLEN